MNSILPRIAQLSLTLMCSFSLVSEHLWDLQKIQIFDYLDLCTYIICLSLSLLFKYRKSILQSRLVVSFPFEETHVLWSVSKHIADIWYHFSSLHTHMCSPASLAIWNLENIKQFSGLVRASFTEYTHIFASCYEFVFHLLFT